MLDSRLASSGLHGDVERLRAQAALSWPKEARALSQIGLRDGMAILEVGSGPGFVTERLLDGLPNCVVTAIDLDPEMCAMRAAIFLGTWVTGWLSSRARC